MMLPTRPTRLSLTLGVVILGCLTLHAEAESSSERTSSLKPRLTFSPSDLEECATSVVTLECSARGRHTLGERVASSSSDTGSNGAADGEDKENDASGRKITKIQIYKKKTNATMGWESFAELRDRNPKTPTGSAVKLSGVEVSGSVGGPAKESYLRVVWDTASTDTFGVFLCRVFALKTGDRSIMDVEILSAEPVELRGSTHDEKGGDKKSGGGDKEDGEAKETKKRRKEEREQDLKWRQEVDERLNTMSQNVERLLAFARGNAYKLKKILTKMAEISSSPAPPRSTWPTRPPISVDSSSPSSSSVSPNTRKIYIQGGSGGDLTSPTPTRRRDRSYTTPTRRRDRRYTSPTSRRDRSYPTPTSRRDRGYTSPTTRRDRSFTTPTSRRNRGYTSPTTRRDRGYTRPTTRRFWG